MWKLVRAGTSTLQYLKKLPHSPDYSGAQHTLMTKKTFEGLSFAFDFAYGHQEDDVAPTDECQADCSRLQPQKLRQMAKISFGAGTKWQVFQCKHEQF